MPTESIPSSRRASGRTVAAIGAAFLLAGGLAATASAQQIVINEIRAGQPGPDLDEYFELKGPAGASLNDLWYIVIGDDDAAVPPAGNGTIEFVLNLSGRSIGKNGFFVVGEPTMTLGPSDLQVLLNFEDNDNVTHLLVRGFTGFLGQDLDTNDDGILDITPWAEVLSAVALVANPNPDGIVADFFYASETAGPDGPTAPSHVWRCAEGAPWEIGAADPFVGTDTVRAENPECGTGPSDPVINEIRIDQPGTDNDEYFELKGVPGAPLDGLTLIVIGDGTATTLSGVIETVVSLDGSAINGSGFFLCAESTFTLNGAIPDLTLPGNGLNFENTDNVTFLLVRGFTGALNQDLDTNDDGILDLTPWEAIVDSVALVTPNVPATGTVPPSGVEHVYSSTIVGPDGPFVPGHAYRCANVDAWKVGSFGTGVTDTPGAANLDCAFCGSTIAGSCFETHETGGCDILEVCSFVCLSDPSCCEAGWDQACVNAAIAAFSSSPAAPAAVISEIRTGQSGPDTDEFVELRGPAGTNLTGAWYLVIGASGTDPNGRVISATPLRGGVIGASGYFVIAEASFTLGSPDLVASNLEFIENRTSTHLLVTNFTGRIGQDIDADNDCTATDLPWVATVSSVTLRGNDAFCGYSDVVVQAVGAFPAAHAFRCVPDDTWTAGFFETITFDTPGAANGECPAPPVCGGEGPDCQTPHATPGCSDASCCEAICAIDPSCCDTAWDKSCVAAANANCYVTEVPFVLISEVRIDQVGADNDEYFELVGEPGTSLAGVSLIVLGDGAGGSGVIEAVVNLTGQTIPADGFFLVTESTFSLPGSPDLILSGNGLNFENTDNLTFLLVFGFTGAVDQDLDTNDDGVLDLTPWQEVLHDFAIVGTSVPPKGIGEWPYSKRIVGPKGPFHPTHVKYCPTTDSFSIGAFNPAEGDDTPGEPNADCSYANPCPADLNGDGTVGAADLTLVLSSWGGSGPADLDGDGFVGASDLTIVLSAWGACP